MHIIILAAGYGTRMQDAGQEIPKALLMVGNIPIIEHQLELIKRCHCVDSISIITNGKFHNKFLEWYQTYSSRFPYKIHIFNDGSTESKTRLGPIKDIAFCLKQIICNNDLLILAGDNAFRIDVDQFNSLRQKKDSNVLGVHTFKEESDVANKYGVVSLDDGLKLKDFFEKPAVPHSKIAATAIYLIRKQDIHEIIELSDTPHDGELNAGELIKYLLTRNLPVHCIDIPIWFDIGTVEDLRIVNEYYLSVLKN